LTIREPVFLSAECISSVPVKVILGRPAFTVFVGSQAGKAFEVLGKRHSIFQNLNFLLNFIFLSCRKLTA